MTEQPKTSEASSAFQPSDKIKRIRGWRRLLVWPLAVFVRLWNATLRFDADEGTRAILGRTDKPVAFILWHNRLFVAAEAARRFRRGRRVHALVSASRDGAWLEAFFTLAGLACVRGSSSKLGREATYALIETVKEGKDIGITPDGPRGPRYEFKPGALVVARRCHADVVLLGFDFCKSWRLKSWDRFGLPVPFSKVIFRAVELSIEEVSGDRDEAAAALGRKLAGLNPDRES